MNRPALFALIAAVLVSGCVAAPMTPSATDPLTSAPLPTGSLVGVVTDDELRPLEGATIRLEGSERSTSSDAEGAFRLDSISQGTWLVAAEHVGHEPQQRSIDISAHAEVRWDAQLPRGPDLRPFNRTTVFEGHYDCAHEIPIWTGDCMILYEAITGQPDTTTEETFAFKLPIAPRWESVVLELEWQAAANNQLDGMRLYLENGNGTEVGHSYKVARADGPESPIRLVLNRGEVDPRADTYDGTTTKAFVPDAGEQAQIRVFPKGRFYDQTSQVCSDSGCFLGVGIGLDIDFKVHATVFYNERSPSGFSAIQD